MDANTLGLIIVGVALVGWCFWLDWDRRIARWWVRCVRGRSPGLIALLVHLTALGGFAVALALGLALADVAGSPRWSLVVVLPAIMVYGPFAMAAMPGHYTAAYDAWRNELERAGASRSDARQIAWWGGPVALVGMILCMVSLFPAILD